ncbi:MAG: hypothetical protein WDO56_00625 [Gammaproteobacteria bacterium]
MTEAPSPGAFATPSSFGFEPASSTYRNVSGMTTNTASSSATTFTIVARLMGWRGPPAERLVSDPAGVRATTPRR